MPGAQPQPGTYRRMVVVFMIDVIFQMKNVKLKSPELEYLSEMDTSVRCFNHSELFLKLVNKQKKIIHKKK